MTQVPHDSRQLRPGIANRLHPGFHQTFLQLSRDMAQSLQGHREFVVIHTPNHLQKLVTRKHQFAHHRHQILKHLNIDANALIGDAGFLGCFFWSCLGIFSRSSLFLFGGRLRHVIRPFRCLKSCLKFFQGDFTGTQNILRSFRSLKRSL